MYKDDVTTFEEVYSSGNICYCKFAREREREREKTCKLIKIVLKKKRKMQYII